MAATDTPGLQINRDVDQVSLECSGTFGGSIRLTQAATPPTGSVIAGTGILWVENTATTRLSFTNSAGVSSTVALAPTVATTDNAIARFDGTTGLLQNSTAIVSDAGELSLTSTGTITTALAVTANSLTTGTGFSLSSSSADVGVRNLVSLTSTNAAATGVTTLNLNNTSTGGVVVVTGGTTTANAVAVTANALTTGTAETISSSSASVSVRNLVSFTSTNAAATGTTTLALNNSSTGSVLAITASATTGTALTLVANALTTGSASTISSSSASASTRVLEVITNSSAAATGTTLLQTSQAANQISVDLAGAGGGSIQFQEIAAVPGGAPAAAKLKLWTRDNTPNQLIFTTDTNANIRVGPSFVLWGVGTAANNVAARFLYPGYESVGVSTPEIQWAVPIACQMSNMRVFLRVAQGTNAVTYTLRVNGVNSLLAVTMTPPATTGSDVADTITLAAGDLVSMQLVAAGGAGTSANDVMVSVMVQPL